MMGVPISGDGIAGLTLACWLRRYGFAPVVIDQASGIRRGGYVIDVFGTGYVVAERMGLIARVQPQQVSIAYIAYVNGTGKSIASLDTALMRKVMHGKYMALMRLSLEEVLYRAVAGDVEVRFGRLLTDVQQGPVAVTVTCSDGTTETFDLLIGADGIHSNTRTPVFGPEKQLGRYLGYSVAPFHLADRYGIGNAWKNYTEPGRLAGAYCSSNEGKIITLFIYKTEDEGYIPRERRLPHLLQAFASMGWITSHLLDDASDPDAIFMDTVTQIQMPTWHRGRAALVGDACGCPTLISGQGAGRCVDPGQSAARSGRLGAGISQVQTPRASVRRGTAEKRAISPKRLCPKADWG